MAGKSGRSGDREAPPASQLGCGSGRSGFLRHSALGRTTLALSPGRVVRGPAFAAGATQNENESTLQPGPEAPRRPPSLHHCRTPTARCPQGTRGLRAPVPRHPGPGGRAVSSRPRFCARALDRPAPGPRRSSPEVRPSSPREPATILLSPKAAREPAAHQGPRHPPWASSGSEPVGQSRPRALSTLGAPRGGQADTVPLRVYASRPDLSTPVGPCAETRKAGAP